MLFRDLSQRSKLTDTGVSEKNIDSPIRLDDFVETINVGQIGNVSLNACNVLADCLHGLVEFLLATACDEDVGTFVNKQLSCREPYPTAPSRDDRNLTFEFLGHCFSPLLLSCNQLCELRLICTLGKSFRTWERRFSIALLWLRPESHPNAPRVSRPRCARCRRRSN